MNALDLERFLHREIPITQALAIHVVSADEARVEIRSPLAPNHNHLGTAFGGSLAAIAILAGYAWIFQALIQRGHDVHVVLRSTSIDYLKPVDGEITAICTAPDADVFETFLHAFERKGLARIELHSTIETPRGTACTLRGEFVAQKQN